MKQNKKRARLLAWILAAALLLPQAVFADAAGDAVSRYLGPPTTAAQKLELLTGGYGAVSAQYAVIDGGTITASGHSGVYGKNVNKALTKDTLYGIGSISKMYTTAIVMKLAENGRVDLDKPVTGYLPAFRMADSRYRDITVRMLLNHSSGLMGSSMADAFLLGDADTGAHDDLLERLSKQNLKADPGAFSAYCNDGFTLAELVAEKVTGKSFTQLIDEWVSKPLGLVNTLTPLSDFDRGRLARIYAPESDQELPEETVGIIGTGGIYSTAEDVCRFAQVFMDGAGKTPAGSVLSRASAEQMAQPEYAGGIWPDKDKPWADGFGLGWDSVSGSAFQVYDIQELSKGGDTLFYHGAMVVLPEKNMAAVVLSSDGSSVYCHLVAEKLLEERLAEKGQLPETKSGEASKVSTPAAVTTGTMPRALQRFSGYYGQRQGIMKVVVNHDGMLRITVPGNEGYVDEYTYAPGSAESDSGAYFSDKLELAKISLVKESNGLDYLQIVGPSIFPGLGISQTNAYLGQRLTIKQLAAKGAQDWLKRDGETYFKLDEKYTSAMYLIPGGVASRMELNSEVPGYIYGSRSTGPDDAKAVLQLPGAGRDLLEFHAERRAGVEYISANESVMISGKGLQEIGSSSLRIGKDGYAVWMKAGEKAGRAVTITVPEKGAFYLYDEDGNCVSSSVLSDERTVTIPEGGQLCLAGDAGQLFNVKLEP